MPKHGGRRRRPVSRWSPYPMMRSAASLFSSFARTPNVRRRRRTTEGIGVTSQYDRRGVYKKRRMPKRRRQRWARFVKKVRAVNFKDECGRSVVFNNSLTLTTGAGNQVVGSVGLYNVKGANGAGELGMGDIYDVYNQDPDLTASNSKFIFKSGILDLTMQANQDNSGTLEIDLYEFIPKNTPAQAGFIAAITDAQSDTAAIGGLGSSISLDQRGTTPFALPQLLMEYTIKKKTKYVLSPGQVATYQDRDPKNRMVESKVIVDYGNHHSSSRFGSRMILIIAKQCPGAAQVAQTLSVGVTRAYTYSFEGCNTYKDMYRTL